MNKLRCRTAACADWPGQKPAYRSAHKRKQKKSLACPHLFFVFVVGRLGNERNHRPVVLNGLDTNDETATAKSLVTPPSLSDALGIPEEDIVKVGGVSRPRRDLEFSKTKPVAVESKASPLPHPGAAPAVPRTANASTAKLFDELSDLQNGPPAARSALFAPEKFDKAKYERDPGSWLAQIRPGRVFQPSQPGDDVKPIASDSPAFHNIVQGEQVVLRAKAASSAPVSFYFSQTGEFANRLSSQTVAADENGIATVTYSATKGTLGIVDIIAASPLHSEQLHFRVNISLPKTTTVE